MLEFEEARKAEADIDDLSGRVADVRGQGEGPGTVKEFIGMVSSDVAEGVHARDRDRKAEEEDAILAVRQKMAEQRGSVVEGDEEVPIERAIMRRGEFKEPFKVGEDLELHSSGEALLLPEEEAIKLARESGAAKMSIEQFIKDLPEKKKAYAQPLIDLAAKAGALDELQKPGEGTEVEQALKAISKLRGKVFMNALAGSLDSLGQDINKVPILGRFTEKILDSDKLADREELFNLIKGYQEDKYDFSLWSSLKSAVGTALPDLALSAIGAGAGVGAARVLGAGSKAASKAGLIGAAALPSTRSAADTFQQAQEQGLGTGTASRLAFASFLSEFGPTVVMGRTGIEKLLVPGVGKEVVKKGFMNSVGRFAKASGLEIAEEEMSTIAGILTAELELNPDMTFEDVIDSMGEAAMAAGVLGLGGGFSGPSGPKDVVEKAEVESKAKEAEAAEMHQTAEAIRARGVVEPPAAPEEAVEAPESPVESPQAPEGAPTEEGAPETVEGAVEAIEDPSTVADIAAADYLTDGGFGVIKSTEYLMRGLSGLFPSIASKVHGIRQKYAEEWKRLGLDDLKDFKGSDLHKKIFAEVKAELVSEYGESTTLDGVMDTLFKHSDGMNRKVGIPLEAQIESLSKPKTEAFTIKDFDEAGQSIDREMAPAEAVTELEGRDKVLRALRDCLAGS